MNHKNYYDMQSDYFQNNAKENKLRYNEYSYKLDGEISNIAVNKKTGNIK